MRIPIDRHSDTPLYQQIADWLRQNILSGGLPPGTRLPATRALAEELGVSRITVKNTYADLESEGVIVTREGSGTFVATPILASPAPEHSAEVTWPLWQTEIAGEPVAPCKSQPPQARHPDLISFTGVGDPRQFALKTFAKTLQEVLTRDGVAALDYGDFAGGYYPLRETVTHILASQGIQAHAQNVLVTSGSQQALSLVCQVLLKAGDGILVEKPTYNLALELFRASNLKIIGVPVDEFGMQVDGVETLLQQYHPRMIYTIPNFQNPSGTCLSGARRRQLLALADRYNVPILEDDFVGDLRYEGHAQPAIKALDPGGRVIYVGAFSKMLMPGLRVGYLLAHGPICDLLVRQKRVQDLTTSELMQRTLNAYVTVGYYQTHLRRSIRVNRQRRDVMLDAIRRFLPSDVTVLPPQGGVFLWLKLPAGIASSALLALALEEGIEFASGPRFFSNPAEGEPYLRLNFVTQAPDEIVLGIRRLATALERVTGQTTPPSPAPTPPA